MAEAIKHSDVTVEFRRENTKKEGLIELVKIDGDKLEVNQDAFKFLNNITDDIVVVSLVGRDCQEKAFLQNMLLDNMGGQGVYIDLTV
jgi:hypothetical protein